MTSSLSTTSRLLHINNRTKSIKHLNSKLLVPLAWYHRAAAQLKQQPSIFSSRILLVNQQYYYSTDGSIENTTTTTAAAAATTASTKFTMSTSGNKNSSSSSSGYSSLSETLHAVTSIKLGELARQKDRLNEHYTPVLEELPSMRNEKEKLKSLCEAMKGGKRKNIELNNAEVDLAQVKSVVNAANADPSMGSEVYKTHCSAIVNGISQAQRKYEYAYLFGSIFNEWLKTDGMVGANESEAAKPLDGGGDEDTEMYEDTGRPELQKQKQFLEATIFETRASADAEALIKYVEALFPKDEFKDEDEVKKGGVKYGSIEWIRKELTKFGNWLRETSEINVEDIKQSVNNLMSGDTLTDSKRAACKEILLSETILSEIASVLTMKLRTIESWAWPEEGINMNFRRQLNGKYRCYLDAALIDAIFLQHCGVKWGIELRRVLSCVLTSNVGWKKPQDPLDARKLELRKHMLGMHHDSKNSLRHKWQAEFSREFFMTMLPENLYDFRSYKEDGDDEEMPARGGRGGYRGGRGGKRWAGRGNTAHGQRLRATEVKQRLLQRVLCDIQKMQAVDKDAAMTVCHVDLEQYGPSLSHEVMLALCEFAGIPEDWVTFFKSFLSVPSKMSEDEAPRTRKCGVPINHSLSSMLSEYILFFLEAAVNRKTEGKLTMVRLHDDFWFWSTDEKLCQKGWQTLREFADLAGLNWNLEKSGSAKITSDADEGIVLGSKPLPQGPVKWGFITLHGDGRWRIVRENVDEHVTEMKRQLRAQRSILGFIKAYNRYMLFFVQNFAGSQPARAFGKEHVEQIMQELNYIHENLFPDHNGSVFEHLRALIRQTFPAIRSDHHILDSWILLPLALGGLGVKNYNIDLHAYNKAYEAEKSDFFTNRSFEDCVRADKKAYEDAKKAWDDRLSYPKIEHLISDEDYEYVPTKYGTTKKKPVFMSFEDYKLGRETYNGNVWSEVWEQLAQTPDPATPIVPEKVKRNIEAGETEIKPLNRYWINNTFYWQWMLSIYGPQLLDEFGRFDFLDKKLIPLGMIDSFNSKKIKWDQ